MIEVPSRTLQADVKILQAGAFPQEMPYLLNQARAFMAELGAGDETLRGSRSSAGSATETAARMTVAKTTLGTAQKRYEEAIARVAAKAHALMAQYYDVPRTALPVSGPGVSYTGADIRGDLRIRVVPGSTRPQGQDAGQQAFIGFANALAIMVQSLQKVGATPEMVAAFTTQAMDLWDQDNRDARESFAALAGGAMRGASAGAGPGPGAAPIASGAAYNPDNGVPITSAPTIPGIGGLPTTGGFAE